MVKLLFLLVYIIKYNEIFVIVIIIIIKLNTNYFYNFIFMDK